MNEIIMELIKQKRYLLTVILLVLILSMVLYFAEKIYLKPLLQQTAQQNQELRGRKGLEGGLDTNSLYKKGVADLKTLSELIPPKRQFPSILGEILDSASSSSLKVGKASYKPETVKEEGLISYSISLSVQGSYAAVKSFLSDLHSKHELIVVEQTSFSNQDLYEELVTMNLRIIVYLKNQEGV